MSLIIEQADFLATIQDLGRMGYQHVGVTMGGPMDMHAFLWNNHLLGNIPNKAQIEIMVGQFKCMFQQPAMVALSGADMNAQLNGQAISPWQSFYVKAGDILTLGMMQQGLYSYLAVKDGFDVMPILGSCTTVMRDDLGGLDAKGGKLGKGDKINYQPSQPSIARNVAPRFIPSYDKEIEIGVITSAQYKDFSPQMQDLFFKSTYTVSQEINRMGYRINGAAITYNKTNLYSEGIDVGAIQIPMGGQPIVLMVDRQTIGGYPKIGYICKSDFGRFAQAAPGTKIRFYQKDIMVAAQEYQEQLSFFTHI
ncbi:MAG: biotin-dependent carboxyltransferase family protein [Alphaproteobacteria bacterium]